MISKTFTNFCRALLCVAVLLISLTSRSGFAQQPTSQEWAFGYEAFNLLLQESDIKICKISEWMNTPSDERFIVLINQTNTDWLPIGTKTPALTMCSDRRSLGVRFRPTLGVVDSNQTENFYSKTFCPIVRPDSTEEVFFGVREIVCNTPGYISSTSVRRKIDEQLYPPTISEFARGDTPVRRRFSVLSESPARRIWVADPLLFTNQMIFKADNLRFADNTVRWLSDDFRRKKVLLMIDGRPQQPVDPNDLEILTPIPTHDEVIEAIRQLPPSDIAKVANSVLQVGEEENIFNDLALNYVNGLADGQINRLILFVIFTCCCAFALITYFWQRRVLRRTASVTASRRQRNLSKRETGSEASERQAAASMLLNSFCLDVANRRLSDWPEFPTPIVSQHKAGPAVKATNEMADAFWRLRTKPKTYWTRETLAQLEQSTNQWRLLLSEDRITLATEA